jgi:hypothetical protein
MMRFHKYAILFLVAWALSCIALLSVIAIGALIVNVPVISVILPTIGIMTAIFILIAWVGICVWIVEVAEGMMR